MSIRVSKRIELDYGHTLPEHFGFCNQIHGHRAFIIATVEGEVNKNKGDSSHGMVLDFKFLKEVLMKKIHAKLDHGFAVWREDDIDMQFIIKRNEKYLITDEPPTAEYLAKWAFNEIKNKLPNNIKLINVAWFETPTSKAVYDENGV